LFDLSCQFVLADPGSFLAVCESFCESTLVRFSGVIGGRTDASRVGTSGCSVILRMQAQSASEIATDSVH
jgi:hypothetical protein